MNRLRVPLLGSNTVIQADRSPSFTSVLRCYMSSPKGKGQNLISSKSVVGVYLPACWLANPKVHRFLKPGQLPTPTLPKRSSIIFLWEEFSQRAPIPIFNPLLNTVRVFVGIWGAHSFQSSPKHIGRIIDECIFTFIVDRY